MIERANPSALVRVWLLGPFVVECRKDDDTWREIDQATWDKYSYGRPLLQRLLCSHRRRVERTTLIDDLWPRSDISASVERYPSDAAYHLRQILRIPDIVKTYGNKSGYELQGQSLVWVDVDECEVLLKEAERIGSTSAAALEMLERAHEHFQRGGFLESQSGQWCYARRATVERMAYRCHLWLAQAYEQQGMLGRAEVVISKLLEENPIDEDALCYLMELLHRQGMTQKALRLYEQTCKTFTEEGIELAESMKQLATRLSKDRHKRAPDYGVQVIPNFSQAVTGSILSVANEQGRNTTDQLRRQIIQQTLRGTGVAVLASHHTAISSDIVERLTQALTRPSTIDEKTLHYLERRIEAYWQDRNDVALPVWDLLPYVIEDLQKITVLLEGSLRPRVRTHLCSIAGATAMLIGELHYDMRNYAQARSFQELAITAAHEANNAALEAVSWARNSFAWTYDGNAGEAYNSIQQARHLGWSVNSTVRTWLAAVEAEIQAHLGNREACLKALSEASQVEDQKHCKAECYWIHFDRSLFAGYQGISFLRLSSLGQKDLVSNAQTALQDALNLLDPSMKRRQATLFVDLAGTYVQQRNIEQACGYALKAVNIATHINSKVSVQRLLALRGSLESWKETRYVQDLDKAISPHLISRGH